MYLIWTKKNEGFDAILIHLKSISNFAVYLCPNGGILCVSSYFTEKGGKNKNQSDHQSQ